MADAVLGDFSRSRAVLIGVWEYTQLQPVDAAEHSLERMRSLLTGPLCGWPSEHVDVVENPHTPADLPHRLVTHFAEATDVALFYFVGHGLDDFADELCLGLGESSEDSIFRRTTSLAYESVRYAFAASDATTKIAILDCCFAELAAGRAAGRLAAGETQLPPSPGFYLMMASGEYSPAMFQLPSETPKPQTYFTKYLADVIDEGLAGAGDGLTLTAIFDAVSDRLVRDGKPEPRQRTGNQAGNFVFARNNALLERGRDADVVADVTFRDALTGAALVVRVPEQCSGCGGTGTLSHEPCTDCRGTGKASHYRGQQVDLPSGVQDGEVVRFERLGFPGPQGVVPGDLLVTVRVQADPLFGRAGLSLTASLGVSQPELEAGTTISLRQPDGSWAAVTIPARTVPGDVVTVSGHGARSRDGQVGNLLVTLTPAEPKDAESAARLMPQRLQKPLAAMPAAMGPVTTYGWSFRRLLRYWSILAAILGLIMGLFVLWSAVPALASFPVRPNFLLIVTGCVVVPLHRQLFAWRRPPLRISDDGLEYHGFGFVSWTDIAGVRPAGPGQPWVTVVLRRTTALSSGRPNPLAIPSVLLSDLRLRRGSNLTEQMKGHCPSLVVDERV